MVQAEIIIAVCHAGDNENAAVKGTRETHTLVSAATSFTILFRSHKRETRILVSSSFPQFHFVFVLV